MSAIQVIRRQFAEIDVELLQDEEGDVLMTYESLAECLGFASADGARTLFKRHSDELRHYRRGVKLTRDGVTREVTCWTRDGIYAFGFLARTERAREFRQWAARVFHELERGDKVMISREELRSLTTALGNALQANALLVGAANQTASLAGKLLADRGHLQRLHPELFNRDTPQQFFEFYEAEFLGEGEGQA